MQLPSWHSCEMCSAARRHSQAQQSASQRSQHGIRRHVLVPPKQRYHRDAVPLPSQRILNTCARTSRRNSLQRRERARCCRKPHGSPAPLQALLPSRSHARAELPHPYAPMRANSIAANQSLIPPTHPLAPAR